MQYLLLGLIRLGSAQQMGGMGCWPEDEHAIRLALPQKWGCVLQLRAVGVQDPRALLSALVSWLPGIAM